MAVSTRSQRQPGSSSDIQPYHSRSPAEWGKFWEGCILWIRTKASVDQIYPSLTDGWPIENWMYDHPCVVMGFHKHPSNGQIVNIAPLTSHPTNASNEFLPIAPSKSIDGIQLSLRGNQMLDKPSYIKRVRFEVDIRLLARYNGLPPEKLRLTKASFKVLIKEIPVMRTSPLVLVSAPLLSDLLVDSGVTPGALQVWAGRTRQQDLESQPLLRSSSEHVCYPAIYSSAPREGSYVMGQWFGSYIKPPLKMALCLPMLLVLVILVVVKALLAPIYIALSNLFVGVSDDFADGPTSTCHRLGKRLLAVLTGDNLASLANGTKEGH